MAKSIKRNFLYNILLNISKVIFPLITAPYVSRVLEPDGVGLFNFANTYANWFALFAALGIPYYGIREIAKIREDKEKQKVFISEIISISIISTLVFTSILLLTLFFVPQLKDNYIVFLIASIVLYFTPIRVEWFFSGKEEFGYITIRSLVIKSISVILLFVLVRNKDDLIIYVTIYAISIVANDLWNFVKIYRSGVHPYFTLAVGKHVKPLFVLLSSSLAISIYALIDTLLLGFLRDYTEVGYYNSATHLSRAFIPIVTSMSAVMLPRITQYRVEKKWDEIDKLINKSFSLIGFLSFPISFGIISIAPVFVPFFFGEMFYGAILPLQVFVITVIIVGFNNLTGIQILLGMGLDKQFLYSIVAGTVSSFFSNMILIPIWGAVGAALSSVIAESVVLITMVRFIYVKTPIRFKGFRALFQCLAVSLLFVPIGRVLSEYFFGWLYVLVVGVVCMLLYVVIQYLLKNPSQQALVFMIENRFMRQNYEQPQRE